MIRLYLIRHSMTLGNRLKRYIGVTDEPLCEEGIALLQGKEYPSGDVLYVSPLIRCRQTASILYPGQKQIVIPGLSECDFGEFENRNYLELADNPQYQKWIDSEGALPFPGGESREGFKTRCLRSFDQAVDQMLSEGQSSAVFVVHGGTIMSILDAYGDPSKTYYDWHIGNAEGYMAELRKEFWQNCEKRLENIKML